MTKKYCGTGKKIKTKFGDMLKISLTTEDIKVLQENLKNGWVNLDVKERREPSEKGNTHYLEINEFIPSEKKGVEIVKTTDFLSTETTGVDETMPF